MGSFVTLQATDGHTFEAYFAVPSSTPRGGIVVIQEIFGVNSHICNITERFAEIGYMAIAPALFDRFTPSFKSGYTSDEIAEGRRLKLEANNDIDNVLLDVDAARKKISRSAGRVGIVGFCWGGVIAWLAACRLQFNAASSYYGGGIVPFVDEKPNCPVIFHFGDQDSSIPLDKDVKIIREKQTACPVYVYSADHGFNCDMRHQYDPYAAHVSGMRTILFFEKTLNGNESNYEATK
ncbi:MAG: Carboxymethylenebutenolidase [Alphaproteobacteria bacterium MarineAlpha3_Bin5]|nr:carboxymethylenebutenolidase [Magnetovibrio sp.]PPR80117.1 MAG: Carboxymethylenebutenolidase [Alphaproteobacteria bacterium MarineAlpha3_Bin5]